MLAFRKRMVKRVSRFLRVINDHPVLPACLVALVALLMRLPWITHGGFGFDIGVNIGWAKSAVEFGVAQSYLKQVEGNMLPNYPPLSILMFAALGHIHQFLAPLFDDPGKFFHWLIKLPAILGDAAIAVLLYASVRKMKDQTWGLIAGFAYALHPAVIHDSAIWGQTDALYTLAMVLALVFAVRKSWFWCGAAAAATVLLKMQGLVLLPIIGLLSLGDDRRMMKVILGGTVVTCVVFLPYFLGGTLPAVLAIYENSIGQAPTLSVGANNLWVALYGSEAGRSDTGLLFGALRYRTVGYLLFSANAALILLFFRRFLWVRPHRAPSPMPVWLASYAMAYAFFVFNTEMHERYLFPAMALGIPMLLTGPAGIALYLFTSFFFLLNLLGVLQVGPYEAKLFHEFTQFPAFIGAAHTFLYLVTMIHLWQWLRKRTPPRERFLPQNFSLRWLKR